MQTVGSSKNKKASLSAVSRRLEELQLQGLELWHCARNACSIRRTHLTGFHPLLWVQPAAVADLGFCLPATPTQSQRGSGQLCKLHDPLLVVLALHAGIGVLQLCLSDHHF